MSFEDPSHWPYWVALVVAALGGGAGLRAFLSRILSEVGKVSDAINTLPVILEKIDTMQADLAKIEIADITSQIAVMSKRLNDIDATMAAYFGTHKDGILIFDEMGKLVWVNPEAARLSGSNRDELTGDAWKASIHPDDATKVINGWESFVAGRLRKFETEFRFSHPDGRSPKVFCRASRDRIGGAQYTRIVCIVWGNDS
jgi:PAS domain S-box-containing protein